MVRKTFDQGIFRSLIVCFIIFSLTFLFTFFWPVAERVAYVLPWKEFSIVIILYLNPSYFLLPYALTSLIAASLASAPELQKKA